MTFANSIYDMPGIDTKFDFFNQFLTSLTSPNIRKTENLDLDESQKRSNRVHEPR